MANPPYIDVVGAEIESSNYRHELKQKPSVVGLHLKKYRIWITHQRYAMKGVEQKRQVCKIRRVPKGAELYVRLVDPPHNGNFPGRGQDPFVVFSGLTEYPSVWVVTNLSPDVTLPHIFVRCRKTMYHPCEVEVSGDWPETELEMIPSDIELVENSKPIYQLDDTGEFRLPGPWWLEWVKRQIAG
jgi:hypothetical protein